ncbi:MAG: cupin domain-containing protein [Lachnospiraceae bacterium]
MKLNFDETKETVLNEFYGGQKSLIARMYVDDRNKIMRGKLEPGASIGLHTHKTSSEIIYILEGNGKVEYDDTMENVKAGECHYCPKGHTHRLINDSDKDLIFFAVVPEQ